MDILDFENFNNGDIAFSNNEGFLKECTDKLNHDMDYWELVKVPVKHELIDELTESIKYEYRYRLYVSTVYILLGYDKFIANQYKNYYWEKDLEGNYTECYLP